MSSIPSVSQLVQRVSRTATFQVNNSVEKVFPLFGPIREKEWAVGWNPEIIYSAHPEVELHMIFKTKGNYADEPEYLWMITQYDPHVHKIEYTVSTINRIWFITVQCEQKVPYTRVTVTYSYTGLNETGNNRNTEMLERMFIHNLQDWQHAIQHYLNTATNKNNL